MSMDLVQPNAGAAARRLIILRYLVLSTIMAPPRDMLQEKTAKWEPEERVRFEEESEVQRQQFWQDLIESDYWNDVSPIERQHSRASIVTISEEQQVNGFWRMEAVQTLMWALGMIEALPPYDTLAKTELLKRVPPASVGGFIESAQFRDHAEIVRARNAAELWQWRSRTRELEERGEPFPQDEKLQAAGYRSFSDIVGFATRKGIEDATLSESIDEDFVVMGKAYRNLTESEWSLVRSITIERHYTLNWLCGYAPENKWDETPTGT